MSDPENVALAIGARIIVELDTRFRDEFRRMMPGVDVDSRGIEMEAFVADAGATPVIVIVTAMASHLTPRTLHALHIAIAMVRQRYGSGTISTVFA